MSPDRLRIPMRQLVQSTGLSAAVISWMVTDDHLKTIYLDDKPHVPAQVKDRLKNRDAVGLVGLLDHEMTDLSRDGLFYFVLAAFLLSIGIRIERVVEITVDAFKRFCELRESEGTRVVLFWDKQKPLLNMYRVTESELNKIKAEKLRLGSRGPTFYDLNRARDRVFEAYKRSRRRNKTISLPKISEVMA